MKRHLTLGFLFLYLCLSFSRAQNCTNQPWIAQSEFHPQYGYWKPIEVHTNGYRVVLLYENPQTPTGIISKYVVVMGTLHEPGMKLVFQANNKISMPRINVYGDVAFYQENIPVQINGRATFEHRLSVCEAQHNGTNVNPDYTCLQQPQTLKIAQSVPFTRPSSFLGPNSAADGAVTGLDWSQNQIRTLKFTLYSLNQATTRLKSVDYYSLSQIPTDDYWEPISVLQGTLPSVYLRLRSVDPYTEFVGTIKQHISSSFIVPIFGGWSHMIHGFQSATQNRIDLTTFAETTNNGNDSSATYSVNDNGALVQHAYYARRNSENTGAGLYFKSQLDLPAYSVERRISPVGSTYRYYNPILVNQSGNADLLVSVHRGFVNNVANIGTEIYRWDSSSQSYQFRGALTGFPQNSFIHSHAFGIPQGGIRILGMVYDSFGQNPRISFIDCP